MVVIWEGGLLTLNLYHTVHFSVTSKGGGMEIWAWESGFLWVEVRFHGSREKRQKVATRGREKIERKGTVGRIGKAGPS